VATKATHCLLEGGDGEERGGKSNLGKLKRLSALGGDCGLFTFVWRIKSWTTKKMDDRLIFQYQWSAFPVLFISYLLSILFFSRMKKVTAKKEDIFAITKGSRLLTGVTLIQPFGLAFSRTL